MKVNIVISPSQQVYNACVMGDSEAEHSRLISQKVVEMLKRYECNVWLIPKVEGTENDILQKVVNSSNFFVQTNPSDADYHLDIHTDAGYDGAGASGFYISEGGKAFIQKIHNEVCKITPWNDGTVSNRDLFVLRETRAIAGLIEISFHDKKTEAEWIHANIESIARAIVTGIVKATEIKMKEIVEITDVDEAIMVLVENGLVRNGEYRKKVCDTVMWEADFVLNVANFVIKALNK